MKKIAVMAMLAVGLTPTTALADLYYMSNGITLLMISDEPTFTMTEGVTVCERQFYISPQDAVTMRHTHTEAGFLYKDWPDNRICYWD